MRKIDAEPLEKLLEKRAEELRDTFGCVGGACAGALALCKAQPTLEGEKEELGHWVYHHRHRGGFRTCTVLDQYGVEHTGTCDMRWEEEEPFCSRCGRATEEPDAIFCPHCGIKMKERVK